MPQQPPTVIADLLNELEANRAMFDALCVVCRADRVDAVTADGRWTVGDHMAHIASFDQVAIAYLQAGADSPTPLQIGGDSWNETQVARRAGRGLDALREEMEALRDRSTELLAALSPAELQREVQHQGDARREPGVVPLRLWLQRWAKHDMIHAREMLTALPAIAANPDFQSWLADDPILEALQRQQGPTDQ